MILDRKKIEKKIKNLMAYMKLIRRRIYVAFIIIIATTFYLYIKSLNIFNDPFVMIREFFSFIAYIIIGLTIFIIFMNFFSYIRLNKELKLEINKYKTQLDNQIQNDEKNQFKQK